MGLLDFAQGASNAAASNVSAPVDGIAWLLRKMGIPVGDAPVGGSDWMAQKGLTAQPKNQVAGLLGEAAGMSGPIAAAAKAPQIARGLLMGAENLAKPSTLGAMGQRGATVWHGSPHKFDAFDSSKIGTGEGAQAYGHGLYLAESPAVAKSYQEALSSTGAAKRTVAQSSGDLDAALQTAQSSVDGYRTLIAKGGGGDLRRAQGMLSIAEKKLADIQRMKAGLPEETGALYKVDLPDEHIAKMLDWDKPLSQQAPEVQKALGSLPEVSWDGKRATGSRLDDSVTGALQYKALANDDAFLGIKPGQGLSGQPGWTQSIVSQRLRDLGIPGIRYLDGGSRGAGSGTSNYVVFPGNEGLLKILERNGSKL